MKYRAMWRHLAVVAAVLLFNAGVVVQLTGVAYDSFSWQAFAQVYNNTGEPPIGDPVNDADGDALKGGGRDPDINVFNPSGCLFNLGTGTIVPGGSVSASCTTCTVSNTPKGADPMDGSMGCFAFHYESDSMPTISLGISAGSTGCAISTACPDQGTLQTSSLNPGTQMAISVGNFPDDALTMLPAACTDWYSEITFDLQLDTEPPNAVINNNIALDCTALCGNNLVDTQVGEQCDDANGTAGDGCSSDCLPEAGFTCPGSPGPCSPICGDSLVVFGETCDDGNTTSGDGCSSSCQTEEGYLCAVPGEPCIFYVAPAPALDTAGLAAAVLVILGMAFVAIRRQRRRSARSPIR